MSTATEIYVSTDIEADGPVPGPHSMLSLGSAAYKANGELVSIYSVNLELLEGASGHPKTMAWWQQNMAALRATRVDTRSPSVAMPEYAAWLKSLPGRPIFLAYPVAFDFMFVSWYLGHFAGENPFGYASIDIRSYAMAVLGMPYGETTKKKLPQRWIPHAPHTHVALDDAIEQGQLFCNMLAERTKRDLRE